jgi:hypothetical protein
MLNGRNDGSVVSDDGREARVHNHIEEGVYSGPVRQINPFKLDAVVDRRRSDGQMDLFPGVHPHAGTGHRGSQSLLQAFRQHHRLLKADGSHLPAGSPSYFFSTPDSSFLMHPVKHPVKKKIPFFFQFLYMIYRLKSKQKNVKNHKSTQKGRSPLFTFFWRGQ